MKLIVESGATKSDWRAGGRRACTPGINFAATGKDTVKSSIEDAVAALFPESDGKVESVSEVWFYGAGYLDGSDPLKEYFPLAQRHYASDLLAAARAVCGHSAGIAGILGTGSNSCLYDGESIVGNVHPSGFILGDEGSAAALGRMFMADYLKGLQPKELMDEFGAAFEVDYLTVVRNVYKGAAPSAYLGGFARWISAHSESCEYVRSLMERNFRDFIERCLKQYDLVSYSAGLVGGFACAHENMLQQIAESYGFRFTKMLPSAIDSLEIYHND